LINEHVLKHLNEALWERQRARQEREREVLSLTSQNWPAVAKYVNRKHRDGKE
jgi:hypothetical protein